MASVVTLDGAGRILLPSAARKQMHLRPGSKILVTEMDDGRLVLTPLDVEELARRIRKEMQGVDIDAEVERVKRDLRDLVEKRYPALARRMKEKR